MFPLHVGDASTEVPPSGPPMLPPERVNVTVSGVHWALPHVPHQSSFEPPLLEPPLLLELLLLELPPTGKQQ